MWGARPRATRLALSTVVATALVFVTFGTVASSALAWGDGDHDSYTVNISPSSVLKDSSTTFDVALTNTSSPGSGLSSALIAPPLGFRVTHVSLPAGSSGHAYVFFNMVTLDRLSLAPGSTLHVAVTATAPSRCGSPFTRWFTWANEGGFFGEDLRLDAANSSLNTTVTCDVATGLQFNGQPNNTLVNSVITGNSYDTSGPPVTVELVDSGGNLVPTSGIPVTIALGSNPGNASLTGTNVQSGTETENTVNGIATFSDLTLNQPDNGYTLTASSSGLTGATSNSFDENNNAIDCPATQTCSNTLTGPNGTSLTVNVGSGTTDATLTESVDVGTPMDGSGGLGDAGCANYAPRSADWYEFVVQPADGTTFDRSKTVIWNVNRVSADGFEVCFGAPYDFQTGFDVNGAPVFAPAGTLPDGSQGFVALLGFCQNLGDAAGTNPCVSNLVQTDSGVQATITIPAGLQGDPWAGR